MFKRVTWLATPVVLALILGVASPASADAIGAKKAEAARIAKKRDELVQTAERLNEESKATKAKLDKVTTEVKQAEVDLAARGDALSTLQGNVSRVAVKAYIYGDSGDVASLVALGSDDPSAAAARDGYASVIAGSASDTVDAMRAARDDTDRLRSTLTGRQESLGALTTKLELQRAAVVKTQGELTALAGKVNGELVQLVADETRRREEAAAAKAKAEIERQRVESVRRAEQQRVQLVAAKAAQDEQARQELAAQQEQARKEQARKEQAAKDEQTRRAGGAAKPAASAPAAPQATSPRPAATAARPSAATPAEQQDEQEPTVSRPPAPNAAAGIAVAEALRHLGKPYVFGASGPNTFDCSGLTQWAWAKAGVSMDHYTGSQAYAFPRVSPNELEPGDLVFFNVGLGHVGLYIGDGQYVHAPRTGDVVKIGNLDRGRVQIAVRPG
jgi:peptidoglycan DL-endopeptidase CwlO